MKKIISVMLCAAMLVMTVYAYSPTESVEVDESKDVFLYADDLSGANERTYTEIGEQIEGTNWRMRNESETPKGLTQHESSGGGIPAKFGINSEGSLFLDAVFNSVMAYNTNVSETIPSLVLDADLSELTSNQLITYEVKKHHNATVTSGIRFMVHNDGRDYYALIFGGNNYNNGTAAAGWQLVKSVNGSVKILKEGGHGNYPGFGAMRTGVGVFWKISIAIDGNKITFKAAQTDNEANSFGASYTDPEMFNVSGNDSGVWLMAMNGNNNPARNASFRNFSIKNYIPYITGSEPENVMYIDAAEGKTADGDGILPLGDLTVVRKIYAAAAADKVTNIYLSQDKLSWDKVSGACFDNNGVWLNNKTQKQYKYISFGSDIEGKIFVFSDTDSETVKELLLNTTVHFYPKSDTVDDPAEFVWTSSRGDVASVSNGEVSLLRKGDVIITAEKDGVSFSCPIKVIGEIEEAVKNGTIAEYLERVKPVFDEINRAITANDSEALKAVFKNTGAVKIESIADIDSAKVTDLSDESIDKFVSRMMTYKSFPCAKIDDVYRLADTIDTEYAVGVLDEISDTTEMAEALKNQNYYLNLNLENKYFKKYSGEVYTSLCSAEFKNAEDLKYKFEQAYVLAGLKSALSPEMAETLLNDTKDEINYDSEHFNEVKSTDLYKAVIDNKASLTDLEKIRNFIDKYTKPKPENNGNGNGSGNGNGNGNGSSSGGSSGGGGGGRISGIKVDADTVGAINDKNRIEPSTIPQFADLEAKHWAYESIMKLRDRNIINGYEDGTFRPEDAVNRAEFIKMLTLAIKAEKKENTAIFSDVSPNDWFYDAVILGSGNGIVSGYPDGSFRPEADITREELAVMLCRAYQGRLSENTDRTESVRFADAASISYWAESAVNELSSAGILSGDENMMFEPERKATRAETAKCIASLLSEKGV